MNKKILLATLCLISFACQVPSARCQEETNAPPVVVASGTIIGSASGAATFGQDLLDFIKPNSTNGLFNADEFNLSTLATLTHVTVVNAAGVEKQRREMGAEISLSYFFTTGLGQRFDIAYANGRATYTSLAGVARTTFGNANDAFMISPYTVLGAKHGIGDNTSQFTAFLGFGAEVPFNFTLLKKKIHGRFGVEMDTNSKGPPDWKAGFTFDWQRKK